MKEDINMLRKINFIFNKKQKFLFFLLMIVILISSFLEMLSISAMMPIVYVIVDPDSISSSELLGKLYSMFGKGNFHRFVMVLLLALIFIYIFKMFFLLFRNYYKLSLIANIQRTIAKRMMVCYLYQPYTFHTENNSAEIQRNIINDVGTSLAAILALIDVIVGGINCAVLIAFLLYTDFLTTLVLMGIFLIFGIGFMKPFSKILSRYGETSRKNGEIMIKWLNQALGGIKEIKVKDNEQFFIKKFANAYDVSSNAEKMNQFIPSIPSMMLETVCFISVLGMIAYKVARGDNISNLITVLAALVLAGLKLLSSFNSMTASVSRVYYTKPALNALYDDLLNLEKLSEVDLGERKSTVEINFREEIKIEGLTYRYPNTTSDVLRDVNFSIKKGESIALIGTSGAGKTTLADLILGVLKPTQGNIIVDGIDIWSNLEAWHSILGYIPQNIYLLDDTIEKNITFGANEGNADEQKMKRALQYAQLQEFVDSLEMKTETIVGECGAKLSGGQRQRIGIARALYNNPQILVLDEATSALDNDTEKAVMEAIQNLQGKVTLIIIAHRLTTIKNCDHIYEVVGGGIRLVSQEEINSRIAANEKNK